MTYQFISCDMQAKCSMWYHHHSHSRNVSPYKKKVRTEGYVNHNMEAGLILPVTMMMLQGAWSSYSFSQRSHEESKVILVRLLSFIQLIWFDYV